MDIAHTLLFSLYGFVLFSGAIAALVFQFRADFLGGRGNPLEPWRLKWSDALLLAWGLVVALLALAIALGHVVSRQEDSAYQIVTQVLGWQGGLLALLLALIYLYPGQFNFRLSPQTLRFLPALWQAVIQLLAALALIIPVNLCWRAALNYIQANGLGSFAEEQEIVGLFAKAQAMPAAAIISLIVTAIIIAPIAEELLFRGMFYRFLKDRISARWAMTISAVCFGAIHGNMFSFVPLTFLGMLLVRAYERSGNLKVPILMHALFNANATFIILMQPYLENFNA